MAALDAKVVVADELSKHYGSGETEVVALDGVSVAFDRHRFTAIMGPSGSGKSTLMHILAGLDTPSSGTVTLDGEVRTLEHGDVFAVPSWCETSLQADDTLDLFTFSDAPVFEKLSLLRHEVSA